MYTPPAETAGDFPLPGPRLTSFVKFVKGDRASLSTFALRNWISLSKAASPSLCVDPADSMNNDPSKNEALRSVEVIMGCVGAVAGSCAAEIVSARLMADPFACRRRVRM